ncbi:N-acetylmuramoyl-L-alanine amidase [Anaerosalibacter sp. Marseille-P3206]|uniref:N-acetylmuramoyl-L-alanine amidase n=1 Tax=Anaerosalibacter sp. Marseille-P3206 TaxID=1871005 RepID=UPI000984921B|nr:N-acetylmuramoyl-L-alanine amidase [Anaerosalibacter sp. Marseille-P3206]
MYDFKFAEKPLEEMVKLLLPTQIDINFHIECLKAQAIVIRNNLLRSSINNGDDWDDYSGINLDKINRAVDETEGLIITFEGNPIMAYYHDSCGGSTENSEDVLDCSVTYLRKVLCDYCKDSPNYISSKQYSIEDLERILKAKIPKENTHEGEISGFIDNIDRDEEGRVKRLTIGRVEYTGTELMDMLELGSTRFYISPLNIQLTSIGRGHGLGFCQNGGNEMAKRGFSFDEILKYYYTGVKIEKYVLPSIKNPLLGKVLILDPGHGGKDFGHIGKLGLKESEIVLKVSKAVKDKLEALGAVVYLSRDEDREVLLKERVEFANHIRPNFLISFHMNYFPNSNMKGCEIYHYRGDVESKNLGNIIQKNLEGEMNIVNRGVREGKFSLFRNIGVNSMIIELGFLSNEYEEETFFDEKYLDNIAEVISKSILEYFENYFLPYYR